ncbi:hypothetical protein DP939_04765 [Spongiactinospora rosea]|uniref:Uncharacterized protein n=1 Tax=Spongiactinospora rosea TaxID=2248750 RepID=A0A366M826_9ACTN|nr:hypothetical protein [Spongiactinospora rosea]RBQ21983.1 hypothetical protein DP939_04765 [Spongiactinospora rosea]
MRLALAAGTVLAALTLLAPMAGIAHADPPGIPTPQEAADELAALVIADEENESSYDRDLIFAGAGIYFSSFVSGGGIFLAISWAMAAGRRSALASIHLRAAFSMPSWTSSPMLIGCWSSQKIHASVMASAVLSAREVIGSRLWWLGGTVVSAPFLLGGWKAVTKSESWV